MSCYANEKTEPGSESVLVDMLYDLGAVPFVKTNTPTGMMMMETDNHVFGPTLNPHKATLSAGGSSGGEGALLALFGSPLGIGTDIGGSIRIPGAFCNLYALKPSLGRYPTFGTRSGIPGQEFINSVNGPMSRTLDTLWLYSCAILSDRPEASPWTKDPKCIPIPWNSRPHLKIAGRPKLRFGMMPACDGLVTAHPPVQRALEQTRAALEAAGHEVVDWLPLEHVDMIKCLIAGFLDFGGPALLPQLRIHNEPIFPSMDGYRTAYEKLKAGIGAPLLGPDEMRAQNMTRNQLAKRFIKRWEATATASKDEGPIDGLIAPVSPWAAVRLGFTNSAVGRTYFGYTAFANLLDLPSCTFPVTEGDRELDKRREDFKPCGGPDSIDAAIQADFDPEVYHGAPVGLQLIGERLCEEKVLVLVTAIRDCLNKRDGGKR